MLSLYVLCNLIVLKWLNIKAIFMQPVSLSFAENSLRLGKLILELGPVDDLELIL